MNLRPPTRYSLPPARHLGGPVMHSHAGGDFSTTTAEAPGRAARGSASRKASCGPAVVPAVSRGLFIPFKDACSRTYSHTPAASQPTTGPESYSQWACAAARPLDRDIAKRRGSFSHIWIG